MTSVHLFELVLVLVGAALVLSLAAGRLHLPPAVALVLGGMVLALLPGVPSYTLDPDLIMVLFLPPLLQASAFFTVWRDFRQELRPILFLSIGAVFFTTAIVGAIAHLVVPGLPWAACFALGAIVSPPDAVAAKAVLQRIKIPARLLTILEGESLVNDASGLVLYKFAVAAALTGSFSATRASLSFVWLVIAGIGIGVVCGLAAIEIFRRLHDGLTKIVGSFLVAWVAYLSAEHFDASGVLSVVSGGIVMGVRGHDIFDAHDRIRARAVWELVVFVLEALVFVLIGLALRGIFHRNGGDMEMLTTHLPLAFAVTATVVIARLAWVFPATYLPRLVSRRLRERDAAPPAAVPLIIGWAGMRGVVTLAAALALPVEFPGRDAILITSFIVILFTVLVQGTTLGPLIQALRLELPERLYGDRLDVTGARIAINGAAVAYLELIVAEGSTEPMHPMLLEGYRRRVRAVTRFRDERDQIELERTSHFTAALGAVATSRAELIRLHRADKIHDSVLRTIESELDLEELRLQHLFSGNNG